MAGACGGRTPSSAEPVAPESSAGTSNEPQAPAPTSIASDEPKPAAPDNPHAEHGPEAEHSQERGSSGYAMDFSDVERFAKHFDGRERDAWQKPEEVVRLLELRPSSVVADLGAGTGYFEGPLSRAVPAGRVIALDVEPNMVAYMQRRAKMEGWKNVEVRVVPPDDPQLEPQSVDRILIVNTWHHISDRERYTQKLASSLRSNGAVVIVDFTKESDMGPPVEHRLPPERVVRELEAGGLKASFLKETLPKQYVAVGRKR